MKIRYLLNNGYTFGGTVRTTINMANALSERGHDVEVISMRRLSRKPVFKVNKNVRLWPLVDMTKDAPAPTTRIRKALEPVRRRMLATPSLLAHRGDNRYASFNLYEDIALLRLLRSVDDGVLIGTRPILNLAIARFARRSVIRIGQEHTTLLRKPPKLQAAIEKYYPRLDAVTALTQGDADAYRQMLGPGQPILAMPNAAPDMGGVRSTLDNKIVISAGRMTGPKGFNMLIEAFAQVVAKHPDWKLHIFGTGSRERQLRRQIKNLGLRDNVFLKGFTNKLPKEMGEASIYALSSRAEGFPLVLLEAMMCGVPAVSFDCPTGPRELIDHGKDGLIVTHMDIDALAAGIIELIEDPERRKAFGAAAYEKAQLYTTERLAQQWEELFLDLAAKRGIQL